MLEIRRILSTAAEVEAITFDSLAGGGKEAQHDQEQNVEKPGKGFIRYDR